MRSHVDKIAALIHEWRFVFACVLIIYFNIFALSSVLDFPSFRADTFVLIAPIVEHPSNYFEAFFEAFQEDSRQVMKPICMWMFYVLYNWWGLDPYPYFLTIFLLHIVICLECFLLARLFCQNFSIALLSSLLYSIFYLKSEVTAWEILGISYAFSLAISLLGVLLFLSKPESVRRSILLFPLFLVSMLIKETYIVFPFVSVLLARNLYPHLKPKHFAPILASSFIYGCYMFFVVLVFSKEYEAYCPVSILDTFRWNLIYGVIPFCFGEITRLTNVLSHLYVIGLVLLYFFLKDKDTKAKIKTLFLCALVCYAPFALGRQGIAGRYNYCAFILIAPMLIILFNEGLSKVQFLRMRSPLNPTVCLVLILLLSNYISTQRIIADCRLAAEITFRDLRADKLKEIFPEVTDFDLRVFRQSLKEGKIEGLLPRVNTVPLFMSSVVWSDSSEIYFFASKVWRLSKQGKGSSSSTLEK